MKGSCLSAIWTNRINRGALRRQDGFSWLSIRRGVYTRGGILIHDIDMYSHSMYPLSLHYLSCFSCDAVLRSCPEALRSQAISYFFFTSKEMALRWS